MSKLYIKGTSKNPKDMVVRLNNQPLTRLQSLRLELDENGNSITHLSFYPSAIEVNAEAEVVEEPSSADVKASKKPKEKTPKNSKKKGVS